MNLEKQAFFRLEFQNGDEFPTNYPQLLDDFAAQYRTSISTKGTVGRYMEVSFNRELSPEDLNNASNQLRTLFGNVKNIQPMNRTKR